MKDIKKDEVKREPLFWFNYKYFYDFIAAKGFNKLVEVGVWKGDSLSHLATETLKVNPKAKFWAVDLFNDIATYPVERACATHQKLMDVYHKTLYELFNDKLTQAGVREHVTDLKGMSWDLANNFDNNSLDFVFIDADHSYDSVVKDLDAWYKKVRSGGIFAGHDYKNKSWPGVQRAVDEFFKHRKIVPNLDKGMIWWVNKK